jgi:ATP-dependent DNA helicase PIF1
MEQLIINLADIMGVPSSELTDLLKTAYPDKFEKKEDIHGVVSEDSEYSSDDEPPKYSDNQRFNDIINASKVKFSDEQIAFMKSAVLERRNIALLAPAGYGKSETLTTTIKLFGGGVQLCASTGRAASLLQARTIHSLLGIGLARGSPTSWYDRLKKAPYLKPTHDILQKTECIIIDEISMIGGGLLDKISEYLKLIKRNPDVPFGGMQMIFVGDFAQLPPIRDTFAFQSKEYQKANMLEMKLTICFRQADPVFQRILDNLRFATSTNEDLKVLRECTSIDDDYSNCMKPTVLVSTNAEVDTINEYELANLCEEECQELVEYEIMIDGNRRKVEQRCNTYDIPTSVKIAIGAQVMVTFNISQSIVNGTLGMVKDTKERSVVITLPSGVDVDIPYISFKDPNCEDVFNAKDLFQYMPLRVAYAISIHKSQGATIPLLEVDAKKVFAAGQLYVAISRATDLRGLVVKNLFRRAIICSPVVKKFYDGIQ